MYRLFIALLAAVAGAQAVTLTPRTEAVTLDGKLDDPLWKSAERFAPFSVLGNITKSASVGCAAMAALKDGYLYIGYRLAEPNMAGIKAVRLSDTKDLVDTAGIWADDCTETFLSPDAISWSKITVNALGSKHWEHAVVGKPNFTWYPSAKERFNGDWDAKAVLGANEWTCEIRVKITDYLGGSAGGEQNIFMNFTRHRPQGAAEQEQNLTYAKLPGQKYLELKHFIPITLSLPPAAARTESALVPKFSSAFSVPDMLLAGAPVKLIVDAAACPLPGGGTFSGIDVGDTVKSFVRSIKIDGNPKVAFEFALGDVIDAVLSKDEKVKMQSPEAFRLTVTPAKVSVTGRTKEGVLRGIASYILMAKRARFSPGLTLPAMTLYDAPRMGFRGWFIQLDRTVEGTKRIIDTAYLMRMNKLFISVGSWGTVYFPISRYTIHDTNYSKEFVQEVFAYAKTLGIEPIVSFMTWARVPYFKKDPALKQFLVNPDDAFEVVVDAANPAACEAQLSIMEEVIDGLNPQGFMIHLDETQYSRNHGSKREVNDSDAAKARNWKHSDWFVEVVNKSHALFKQKNVQLYMWGDMIDPTYNGKHIDMCGNDLLARLPKDIVILDWKYAPGDHNELFDSLKLFTDGGVRTIGGPWFRPGNISRMANTIKAYRGEGIALTSWNSTLIQDLLPEVIRAVGLTSYYGWSPENCDLAALSTLPDLFVHCAAYWTNTYPPVRNVRPLKVDEETLMSDDALMQKFGLPSGTKSDFLAGTFSNFRGVLIPVFMKQGKPAALAAGVTVASSVLSTAPLKNGPFDVSDGWTLHQPPSPDDGSVSIENGRAVLKRVNEKAFMRIYQDVKLDVSKQYTVRGKVGGSGSPYFFYYHGDESMKIDGNKFKAFNVQPSAALSEKEFELPAGLGSVRLCLMVNGANTTAYFDDIAIVERSAGVLTVTKPAVLPVNGKAGIVTFQHAVSRMDVSYEMHDNAKRYKDLHVGTYEIRYADGSTIDIPLTYRIDAVAVNDSALGTRCDMGLFGTVGNAVFVNIPTYTWENPHREKTITEIRLHPSKATNLSRLGVKDMSLLLFGAVVE